MAVVELKASLGAKGNLKQGIDKKVLEELMKEINKKEDD
jgi:hypothetical protein